MSVYDVFANIGMKIRAYFWKLGYLAGRVFGEAGRTTFDDAFSKGVSSIALDSIDLDGIMTEFEDHWKNQMTEWSEEMTGDVNLNSKEGAEIVLSAMAPLLFSEQQDEMHAAYGAFSMQGWTYTEVKGTNDGTTFTPSEGGDSHLRVEWVDEAVENTITAHIGLWNDGTSNIAVVMRD